ncbi:hypothetical protein BC835DRAFT_1308523 [Cytidiella melzeri]|nr:hypothetical protein BC835DRAFT_1308523 [Cytidiella melzeri]
MPSLPKNQSVCAAQDCSKKRVNRNCERRMCLDHCTKAGGCTANGHSSSIRTSRSPATVHAPDPPTSQPHQSSTLEVVDSPLVFDTLPTAPSLTPATPSLDPTPFTAGVTGSVPVAAPSLPAPVRATRGQVRNATPGPSQPRHATQMKEVFTVQHDTDQALAARKREILAEKLKRQTQIENQVTITVWKSNDAKPRTHIVQEGYTFPVFACTRDCLVELGLLDDKALEGRVTRFQVYDSQHQDWRQVAENHCLMLKAHDHLLFAACYLEPENMQDLDRKMLLANSGKDLVHMSKNLAGDREFVRAQEKKDRLAIYYKLIVLLLRSPPVAAIFHPFMVTHGFQTFFHIS